MTETSSNSSLRDLAQLDQKLLDIFAKRHVLHDQALRAAPTKPGRPSQAQLEKELWKTWQDFGRRKGFDLAMLRQLFDLVQGLEPQARLESRADKPFGLAPRKGPFEIQTQGPLSSLQTRAFTVIAALSGQPMDIPGALLNEPLIELVKALNPTGAALWWDQEGLKAREAKPLDLQGKSVFVGDDSFNLHLLIAMATANPGWVKIMGGLDLKLIDLMPLGRGLQRFGARLVSLVPHAHGLPARIEASGTLSDEISLPSSFPDEAVAAFAVVGPFFRGGLRLRWSEERNLAPLLAPIVDVLRACEVPAELRSSSLNIAEATPRVPEQPKPSLDPFLSTCLLLIPRLSGGNVVLRGRMNLEAPQFAKARALFELAGVKVVRTEDGVMAWPESSLPPRETLYRQAANTYFPLFALIAAQRARIEHGPVALGPEVPDASALEDFLGQLGLAFDPTDGQIEQATAETREESDETADPWFSPDAEWTLAYALAGLFQPGLTLANPGNLTRLHPGFWNFYNALGKAPEPPTQPKGDEHDGQERRPRRIRAKNRS